MSYAELWELPEVVAPEWEARRALADAVRRLVDRCVRTEAGEAALRQAAEAVEAIVRDLPGDGTSHAAFLGGTYVEDPRRWIDRGAVLGRCNPVAPPMKLRSADGESRGELVLGEAYVGAPGMVHGGVIAACFDQLCGHAVVMAGLSGLTTELDVRYHHPTRLGRALQWRAKVSGVVGRKVAVEADCSDTDGITASCRATFVQLDARRAAALIGQGAA